MDLPHEGLIHPDRDFYRAMFHMKARGLLLSCASYPSAPSVAPHGADLHTLPDSTPFVDHTTSHSDRQSNHDASTVPVPPPNTPTASDSNSGTLSSQGETAPPSQPVYSPRITNFTRGNQPIDNGTTEGTRPAHVGYIHTAVDAALVFEACLSGKVHRATHQLTQDECPTLIRSGSIFIYEEGTTAGTINRWIDGLDWTCSRQMGDFVVYGAFEALDDQKQRRRPRFFRENQETVPAPAPAPAEAGYFKGPMDDQLCGPLIHSFGFPTSGLVKKTLAIKTEDKSYRLVSYFRPDDVRSEKLIRPIMDPNLWGLKPRYSVLRALLSERKSPDPNGPWVCLNEHHQGQDCGAGSAVIRSENPVQRQRSLPTANTTIFGPKHRFLRPHPCKEGPPKAQARGRPSQQSRPKPQATKRKEKRQRKPKKSLSNPPIEHVFVVDINPGSAAQQPQSPPKVDSTNLGNTYQSPYGPSPLNNISRAGACQSPSGTPKVDNTNLGNTSRSPYGTSSVDNIDRGEAYQSPDSPPKVDSTNTVAQYPSPYGTPKVDNTDPGNTYQSPHCPPPVDNTGRAEAYPSPYGTPEVDNTYKGNTYQSPHGPPPVDNTNNTSPGYTYPQLQDLPIATGAAWYHGPPDQAIPGQGLPTPSMANTFPYLPVQPFDNYPPSASHIPVFMNDGNSPVFLSVGEDYHQPFTVDPHTWLPGREHLSDLDEGYCSVGGSEGVAAGVGHLS